MTTTPAAPNEQSAQLGWFDQQFKQIGWPMLIALMVLFTVPMWIFSGVGVLSTKNPVAHRKAKVIFIVSTIYAACCGVAIFVLVRHPGLLE